MEHHIKFSMKHIIYNYCLSGLSHDFDLGIKRQNQGHLVFIGLCIIDNVLLDSGAFMPRGLLFIYE